MQSNPTRPVGILFAAVMLATVSLSSVSAREDSDLLRFRAEVMASFQQAHPDANFRADPADPARILSDSIFVDVTNLYNRVQVTPAGASTRMIEDFTAGMLASMNQPEDVRTEELVTVLRSAAYIDYLETGDAPHISRPVTDGLYALVMRDTPRAYQTVGPDAFADESPEALLKIGTANVARFLSKVGSEKYDDFVLYYVEDEPDLTNALALIPEFWDTVRAEFGEEFVFIIPRRDQIFVFGGPLQDTLVRAVAMIDATFSEPINLLSPEVYGLEGGQIIPIWTPEQGMVQKL